ncbi:hypothetical protein VTL71DRAFT_13378, partial [Oculimacula yallundae]
MGVRQDSSASAQSYHIPQILTKPTNVELIPHPRVQLQDLGGGRNGKAVREGARCKSPSLCTCNQKCLDSAAGFFEKHITTNPGMIAVMSAVNS